MKNSYLLFADMNNSSIFAVRNFLINNVMGIFYAHKASILKHIEKLYPCLIDHMAIREFRRLGYGFSFFINNK